MKLMLFLICLVGTIQLGCTQVPKNYAPINFLKHINNPKANEEGLITLEVDYEGGGDGNEAGDAYVYMIHKNGGDWWVQQAEKSFPKLDAPLERRRCYAVDDAKDRLLKQDSLLLKDYNKWAFFVDKKYLVRIVDGSTGVYGEIPSYGWYLKPNITYEQILYEQKAGSNVWLEIERKKIKSGADGESIDTIDPKTGKIVSFDFSIDQKLKENNAQAPKK